MPSTFVPLTQCSFTRKLCGTVAKWNVSPAISFLLLALLLVIGLIQVLPQVDLPDTAFHEDTAPVVTKLRAVAAPILSSVIVRLDLQPSMATRSEVRERYVRPSLASGNMVPILLCSLLC